MYINLIRIGRISKQTLFVAGMLASLYLMMPLLLPMAAGWLIRTDEPASAQALFVLSGGEVDRGREAARLMNNGYFPVAFCTGELKQRFFEEMGLDWTEGHLTRMVMTRHGADSTKIRLLNEGTSTYEECAAIVAFCQNNRLDTISILSHRLHTRRIRQVAESMAVAANIEVSILGAPDGRFDEDAWFRSEDGLIFVVNELAKTAYYWLRY